MEVGEEHALSAEAITKVWARRIKRICSDETKIVAVSRTQHQPMISEPDRAAIAVNRRMSYIQDGHGLAFRKAEIGISWPVLHSANIKPERSFPRGIRQRASLLRTRGNAALHGLDVTFRVMTLKPASVHGPNEVTIATSVASRPRAIRMRPMRGLLWRASNVYQRPPR